MQVIIFRTSPESHRCTSGIAAGGTASNLTVHAVLDRPEVSPYDLDEFSQKGKFKPLNWNGVTHAKLDGYVDLDLAPLVDRFANPKPDDPMKSYSSSQGIYRTSDGKNLVYPDQLGVEVRPTSSGTPVYIHAIYVHVRRTKDSSKRIYDKVFYWKYGCSCSYTRIKPAGQPARYVWKISSSTSKGIDTRPLRNLVFDDFESLVAAVSGAVSANALHYANNFGQLSVQRYPTDQSKTFTASPPMDYHKALALLRHDFANFRVGARAQAKLMEPKLHASAFDAIEKFDGNFLVLLSKLNVPGAVTIQSIKDLFVGTGSLRKDLASFWLANRFGDRLLMKGITDLVQSLDKYLLTVGRRTERYVKSRARLSSTFQYLDTNGYVDLSVLCAITPSDYNAFMRIVRVAYEWDFYPSLANVWDAIPLSFVVDWIGNVGDVLGSIDRLVQSRYYNVAAILQSIKATGVSPHFSDVQFSWYERTLGNSLNLGVQAFELGLPRAINIIDGAALICGFV